MVIIAINKEIILVMMSSLTKMSRIDEFVKNNNSIYVKNQLIILSFLKGKSVKGSIKFVNQGYKKNSSITKDNNNIYKTRKTMTMMKILTM